MRALIGVLVLGLCAWRTHARAQDWRSDQALWTAATVSAPELPRPWLNLASAARVAGDYDTAWRALQRAVETAEAPRMVPVRTTLQTYALRNLWLLDAVEPRCDTPRGRPLCASLE